MPPSRSSGPSSGSSATPPLWSWKLALDEVPEAGLHVDLEADAATRSALAEAIGLRELPRLEASLDLAPFGRSGLRVEGEVLAIVGQTCVVSLEPLENELREPVSLIFSPPEGPAMAGESSEVSVDFGDAEPHETLAGGEIDLGAIAVEFLILGIDPYPRKEGAEFSAPAKPDAAEHPFAALAALKKAGKKDEGK